MIVRAPSCIILTSIRELISPQKQIYTINNVFSNLMRAIDGSLQ